MRSPARLIVPVRLPSVLPVIAVRGPSVTYAHAEGEGDNHRQGLIQVVALARRLTKMAEAAATLRSPSIEDKRMR
jgi:hypothetical protein